MKYFYLGQQPSTSGQYTQELDSDHAKNLYIMRYKRKENGLKAFEQGIPVYSMGTWTWGEAETEEGQFKQMLLDNNFKDLLGLRISKKDRIYTTAQ